MPRSIPQTVLDSWPISNDVDPEKRGPAIAVIAGIGLLLCTAAVSLKLYTKFTRLRPSGIDDWVIVAAWVFAVGNHVASLLGVYRYSGDLHIWDFRQEDFRSYRIASITAAVFYYWAASLTKVTLLVYYRKLYKSGVLQHLLDGVTVFMVVYLIAATVLQLAQCRPIKYNWLLVNPESSGHCLNEQSWMAATGFINAVADVVVLLLPVGHLYNLNMSKSQKLQLGVLLSLGMLVCVAGGLRVYYIYVLNALPDFDTSWIAYNVLLWSIVEVDISLICASLPSCTVLVGSEERRLSNDQQADEGKDRLTDLRPKGPVRSDTFGSTNTNSRMSAFSGLGVLADLDKDDYMVDFRQQYREASRTGKLSPKRKKGKETC